MSAADLAAQVLGLFDARLGDEVIGQNVDVAGDGNDVAAGEPRARESRTAALADGDLTGEDGLNAAHAAGYKDHRCVDAMLIENLRVLGDPQDRRGTRCRGD